jgi:hypothetical protein
MVGGGLSRILRGTQCGEESTDEYSMWRREYRVLNVAKRVPVRTPMSGRRLSMDETFTYLNLQHGAVGHGDVSSGNRRVGRRVQVGIGEWGGGRKWESAIWGGGRKWESAIWGGGCKWEPAIWGGGCKWESASASGNRRAGRRAYCAKPESCWPLSEKKTSTTYESSRVHSKTWASPMFSGLNRASNG